MASACLPFMFKAVDVGGEDYWDGGYVGNPALFPLFYETDTRDVLIVHINPMLRPETPTTAPDIMNRINEISFNASLLKEMRAIAFVKKLIDDDMLKDEYKDDFTNVLVHSIRADKAMCDLSVASKFDSSWDFLTMLRDRGREAMAAWLDAHYDDIGVRDTVDLNAEFLRFSQIVTISHLFKRNRVKRRVKFQGYEKTISHHRYDLYEKLDGGFIPWGFFGSRLCCVPVESLVGGLSGIGVGAARVR